MSRNIPLCAGPDPFVHRPGLGLPAGAIDCHAHVFGPQDRYAYTPNRSYTPPDAPPGAYLHMHQQLGIERGVLVQPSVYGTDNSLQSDTLSYLKQLGKDYRGVAVVDADVSDQTLDQLTESGHCGVRMNLLFKGGIEWRDVTRLADRLADRQWHLQFLVDVSEFEDFEHKVRQLPVPVVVDHMGHMSCQKGLDHSGFIALLNLMRDGQAWVKLSGAYRITGQQTTPYTDVTPFAQALIEANPEQCVWGSDWPHPHFSIPMPNAGDLLDMLGLWLPDACQESDREALLQQIMLHNPGRLYGFD